MTGGSQSDTKTDSITCSGSTEVSPNSMVDYDIEQTIVNETYRTFTDIKFTKCSFFFREDSEKSLTVDDTDHFIYQFNVPGVLLVKQAQKCSVRFYASVALNPSTLKCDDAQKQWAFKYDTYTPQCIKNNNGGFDWSPCQCDYGHSLTQALCNCVDPTNGILIPGKSHVMDTNENHRQWCNDNCGTNFVIPINAKISNDNFDAQVIKLINDDKDMITLLKDSNVNENNNVLQLIKTLKNDSNNTGFHFSNATMISIIFLLLMISIIFMVYYVNKMTKKRNGYHKVSQHSTTDTDNMTDAI